MSHNISMHEAALVRLRAWQVVKVELLKLQNYIQMATQQEQ